MRDDGAMRPFHFMPTLLLATLAGCATHPHAPPATADPATAAAAVAATQPDRPLRVTFEWRALEGEARFNGRGVARIEPPYHARLDLFGPRGDTYLSAALVHDQVRLPPGVQAVQIPPPALMWAVLGVVAPPQEAVLVGTRDDAGRAELYYDVDGGSLRYVLEGGALRSVRWDGAGRRMTVELRGQAGYNLPTQAVYRDQAAVTELMLNLESVDEVDAYSPDIWWPGG
jgi:hypothetical protein